MKEKLCVKRALTLCHCLLTFCTKLTQHTPFVVNACKSLLSTCTEQIDDQLFLLSFECTGLLCLIDKEIFIEYAEIFNKGLVVENDEESANLRGQVIAIKCTVDGLLIHGRCSPQASDLFRILTSFYLRHSDALLRRLTAEGVCKMFFTLDLCEESESQATEAILATLILVSQLDPASEVNTSIFLSNFTAMSPFRCRLARNALTKVLFSVIFAIFKRVPRLDSDSQNATKSKALDMVAICAKSDIAKLVRLVVFVDQETGHGLLLLQHLMEAINYKITVRATSTALLDFVLLVSEAVDIEQCQNGALL